MTRGPTRGKGEDVLICLTARRLQAIKDLIERAQEEGVIPVEDRDVLAGVKRQIRIRLKQGE